jgi:hypothetical protein
LANWLFLEPNQTFLKTLLSLESSNNFIGLESIELSTVNEEKRKLFTVKVLEKLVKNNS